jgi:hypothetical protein
MKIGDLAEFIDNSCFWGVIVGIQTFEYEVYWMDGDRSWIIKKKMVKRRGDL